MASVNMPTSLGASGNSYSDDANPDTGLRRGGAKIRLIPLFQDLIAVANFIYNLATSAVSGPTNTATSVSPNTIGTGDKTFAIAAGKSISPGQTYVAADSADPVNKQMTGKVKSYVGTSLVLTVGVGDTVGAGGTSSNWIISISVSKNGLATTADLAAATAATTAANNLAKKAKRLAISNSIY